MKVRQTLASLSRARPFSSIFREFTVAKAKTLGNDVTENVTDPILPCVQQRLMSLNSVGFKYLSTAATNGETEVEAEFATAKTSVWWDLENCSVPKGCEGHKIALNIKSALEKLKYSGPLTIYAYGDTNQITSSVQQALSSTGVSLIHVPPGVKDGSDKTILVDMLLWAMENRAPANMMLISGDGDSSYVLHRLRINGYNVLLVRPGNASAPLISAAKTVWLWKNTVAVGSDSKVSKQTEASKRMKKASLVASQSDHVEPKTLWCSICQVHYPIAGHEEHISGQRHQKKFKVQARHSS